MKTVLCILVGFCLSADLVTAQVHEFKIASYNTLRYSPTNVDGRHPDYRAIMNDLKPDLLLLEELSGLASAQMFIDSVLNLDSTTYSMASFIDGNDLDISLYYKTSKFTFVSTKTYPTQLRPIYHFEVIPTDFNDTLHVFGVHLKASSGSSNEVRRAAEVDTLRKITNSLPLGSCFIVGGDFNIYKSTEPAYQALLQTKPGTEGHFIDTIKTPGTWNNAAYAQHHTQSPRTMQFGGGAHGGLDDRFDLLLMSSAIAKPGKISYVAGSMLPYGNDGQHYNVALTDPPANSVVSATIAQSLHDASDHLPITASFSYSAVNNTALRQLSQSAIFISNITAGFQIHNPQNLPFEGTLFSINGQQVKTVTDRTDLISGLNSGLYVIMIQIKGSNQLLGQKLSIE